MKDSLPLKPIHLPPDPSWWPPAPGWWLLAVLVLILLALGVWLLLRWQIRRRKRQWLQAQLAELHASQRGALLLHRLLRRAIHPLLTSTSVSEADWSTLLERLAGKPLPALASLEAARYRPDAQLTEEALTQARPLLELALLHPRKARKRLTAIDARSPS